MQKTRSSPKQSVLMRRLPPTFPFQNEMTEAQGSELNWIFQSSEEYRMLCDISICKRWQHLQIF